MVLTLSRHDVERYTQKNRYALMMLVDGGHDYVASRCCILNALHSGFRLASESVEKLLKAHIYLATGQPTNLKGPARHDPFLLKHELVGQQPDPVLDGFDQQLRKLHDHYQNRYFDNPVTGQGASSEELFHIDALVVRLIETLPVPLEVKYRNGFLARLCDDNARHHWHDYYWAMERNAALQPKMPLIEQEYRAVLRYVTDWH